MAVVAIGTLISQSPMIPKEALQWIGLGQGVVNIVLRIFFTDKPVTFN